MAEAVVLLKFVLNNACHLENLERIYFRVSKEKKLAFKGQQNCLVTRELVVKTNREVDSFK